MSAVQHLRPPALERVPAKHPPRRMPTRPRAGRVTRGNAHARIGSRTGIRSRAQALAALAAYTALAALTVGRAALAHPAAGTIGAGPDVQVFLWGLRWWPYAIAHGIDPTVSHVVWGPTGSNVLWTTTVPLLSLLAAPITLTLGPAVAGTCSACSLRPSPPGVPSCSAAS